MRDAVLLNAGCRAGRLRRARRAAARRAGRRAWRGRRPPSTTGGPRRCWSAGCGQPRPCARPRRALRRRPSVGALEADREGRLEVVPGVGAERDVGLGVEHARHLVDPAGDHLGDLLELADPHDRDQVDVAGDRVDLADAVEIGDRRGDLGDLVGGGVDHHDGGDHAGDPSRARRRAPASAAPVGPGARAQRPAVGERVAAARPASTRARNA